MTVEQAIEAITYLGMSYAKRSRQHDLQRLVAEVVVALPYRVGRWLLYETRHVFIVGEDRGAFHTLSFAIDSQQRPLRPEIRHGMMHVRIIYLSGVLMKQPRASALFTIAHEIAHSRLNHEPGSKGTPRQKEAAADALARKWGFPAPRDRVRLVQSGFYG